MTQKIYTGDTGTVITLDAGQNITAATALAIEVRKPNGAVATWTATASGTDSLTYTSLADTFDQAGTWHLQAAVTLPSGEWLGATVQVQVYWPFE